jgi:hypothetical protein
VVFLVFVLSEFHYSRPTHSAPVYVSVLCGIVLFHWTATRMAKIWVVYAHDVNGGTIITDHRHVNGNIVQRFKIQHDSNKLSAHAMDDVWWNFH